MRKVTIEASQPVAVFLSILILVVFSLVAGLYLGALSKESDVFSACREQGYYIMDPIMQVAPMRGITCDGYYKDELDGGFDDPDGIKGREEVLRVWAAQQATWDDACQYIPDEVKDKYDLTECDV